MGPRITFWELADSFETVNQIASGYSPNLLSATDPEINETFQSLRELLVKRLAALNETDWEYLVADYLKAQGAHVDEPNIGGNRAIIDVEARFDLGELGESIWRIQVKRLEGQKVDWPDVEYYYHHAGDAHFGFVSVFGFTDNARLRADEEGIRLLEAADFARFLLSGKLRNSVARKLQLPFEQKIRTAAP